MLFRSCAKVVYNKDLITKELGEKTEEEYKKEIWKQIKEIKKEILNSFIWINSKCIGNSRVNYKK